MNDDYTNKVKNNYFNEFKTKEKDTSSCKNKGFFSKKQKFDISYSSSKKKFK